MWKKDETPKAPPPESPRAAPAPPKPAGGRAVIGNSLVVDGSIRGEEDLQIDGRVVGDITLPEHTVTVGGSGDVEATITARVIVVDGRVQGDLFGGEQIEIRRSGNVLGNITSPRVGLEDGAQFKGNIDMSPKGGAKPKEDAARREQPKGSKAPGRGKGADEPAAEKAADAKLSG